MASKTSETTKKRSRKAASVQPPVVVEARQDVALVSKPATANLDEEIRRRAYELYLERGGTPGNPHEDWLVAEQQVRSREMHQAG